MRGHKTSSHVLFSGTIFFKPLLRFLPKGFWIIFRVYNSHYYLTIISRYIKRPKR